MGPDAIILVFLMLSFKPAFPLSPFTFIQSLFKFPRSVIAKFWISTRFRKQEWSGFRSSPAVLLQTAMGTNKCGGVFGLLSSLHSSALHTALVLNWRSFPGGSDGKESACNAGDPSFIPVSGKSPGKGNGHLLQSSCLKNSVDRGTWWAAVHRVTKSQTRLSNWHFPLTRPTAAPDPQQALCCEPTDTRATLTSLYERAICGPTQAAGWAWFGDLLDSDSSPFSFGI